MKLHRIAAMQNNGNAKQGDTVQCMATFAMHGKINFQCTATDAMQCNINIHCNATFALRGKINFQCMQCNISFQYNAMQYEANRR